MAKQSELGGSGEVDSLLQPQVCSSVEMDRMRLSQHNRSDEVDGLRKSKLSDPDKNINCAPCRSQGEVTRAVKWCLHCGHALCSSCLDDHRKKFPSLIHHRIVELCESDAAKPKPQEGLPSQTAGPEKGSGVTKGNGVNKGIKIAAMIAAPLAVGVGAVLLAPVVLGAVGFTSAGVAAGSIAAAIQGPMTAAGSTFAVCQSVGAAGLGVAGTAAVGGTAGAVTAAGEAAYVMLADKKKEDNPK